MDNLEKYSTLPFHLIDGENKNHDQIFPRLGNEKRQGGNNY